MKILVTSIILLLTTICIAQTKSEYEQRISQEEFPLAALTLLQPKFDKVRRLRFYVEFDGTHKSFEAKFKWNKKQYSAEFTAQGILEDVEVDQDKKELRTNTRKKIETYLDATYERWKIEKIQQQYRVLDQAEKTLEDAYTLKELPTNNLELIVATKSEGKLTKFEMLFDSKGNFVQQRKVHRRSYDFLLF
ncbi:hypothetical protein [Marinirhabdus gelatinilytica]|uniref:Uncharacterized protein n=1 Tax=Marinirhabdus gelatinilytica TaxID=1703343 RepID=A0A370QKG3_9FLAO|nr:hypothetical protein [Marinirhabdus gelatinilytica]RDK88819.1 hypothetical protein C8D94_101696 [Marinirhabdus gelatinilytica]